MRAGVRASRHLSAASRSRNDGRMRSLERSAQTNFFSPWKRVLAEDTLRASYLREGAQAVMGSLRALYPTGRFSVGAHLIAEAGAGRRWSCCRPMGQVALAECADSNDAHGILPGRPYDDHYVRAASPLAANEGVLQSRQR